jgi:hypothetical protein
LERDAPLLERVKSMPMREGAALLRGHEALAYLTYSAFSTAALPREPQVVGVGVDARPRRGRRTITDLGLAGEQRQIGKAEYMIPTSVEGGPSCSRRAATALRWT